MPLSRRAVLAAAAAAGCTTPASRAPDVDALRRRLTGRLITPTDADYDRERRSVTFNPRVEARPVAIVLCASADDVARTIAFARESGIDLAVRAGGHDVQGASSCNGVVADLRMLNTLDVQTGTRSARLGTGLRAGGLSEGLGARGLAPVLGCDLRVGVSGLTLGGGLGWLVGRHGAACDNIISARLVTADSRVLRVSRDENSDLFWALKGGGGNFGVVTEHTLAAHPMGEVVQGIVAHAANQPSEYLRFYRDFVTHAGPDLGHELYILPRPTPTAFLKLCYSGPPENAERVFAPLLAYGPPLAHTLARGAYTGGVDPSGDVATHFNALPSTPRLPDDAPGFIMSGFSAAPFSDTVIDAIAQHIAHAEGARWSFGSGYLLQAAALVGPDASAWPRHEGQMSFFFGAGWRRADDGTRQMNWLDRSAAIVGPHCGPTYINFITTQDPRAVEASYGANYPRLRRIKRRYDPDNLFHRNRNIAPL